MPTVRKYIYDVKTKGTEKAAQSVNKLSGRFGSLAAKVGVAAAAYFSARGLISGFQKAIQLAGEQEQAERQLETALGYSSSALLSQASALQQVSVYGDETIIRAQALIAAFVDDEEQIKKATAATLDLAAAKGMDLNAAADMVSKTLGSSTNALSRYGITVEGAVGSTERLDMLVGNISDKFGGQAAAQADTMTGSIQQMKNAVGDTAEAIGSIMSPVVIKFAGAIKGVAEGISDLIDARNALYATATIFEPDPIDEYANKVKSLSFQQLIAEYNKLTASMPGAFALVTDEVDLTIQKISILAELLESFTATPNAQLREATDLFINLKLGTNEYLESLEKVADTSEKIKDAEQSALETSRALTQEKLRNAALGAQSAREGVVNTIRGELAEATAGYISSIFQSVPFPLNLILAAAGGGAVNELFESVIPSYASGGDFVTSGPQMIRVGDNPGGRERVQVTPLSGSQQSGGGMTLIFSGPITNADYVRDVIVPEIEKAQAFA